MKSLHSTLNYLGCTIQELYLHLEKQFTPEMNWDNYGSYWHIDHIIPLSAAKNDKHIYELSHYTNLQPLEAKENLSKNNKITKCWQKFQKDKNEKLDRELGYPFDLDVKDFTLAFESLVHAQLHSLGK